jgi:hypothetical protein
MRLREALVGACGCACAAAAFPAPLHAEEGSLPWVTVPRPPLPEAPPPQPVPWNHHIEIGVGPVAAEMPVHLDGNGNPTRVRLTPGPGFNIDLSWQIFRYLRFTGYLFEHNHAVDIPAGSLGMEVPEYVHAPSTHVYSFGVRASPTLPLGARMRLWLTAGFGWGYVGYGTLTLAGTPPSPCQSPLVNCSSPTTIHSRAEYMFEIPLGLGGSIEIIPRWLSLRFEIIGAFMPSQTGDALGLGQYIDVLGMKHPVGPMPRLDASFVETVGFALHL